MTKHLEIGGLHFSRSMLLGTLAATAYGLTSISIVLFNKMALSGFEESLPFTLAWMQNAGGALILYFLSIVFPGKFFELPRFSMSRIISSMLLSVLNTTNVALSLFALVYTSVPTYGTLRRLTLLTTLCINTFYFHKRASAPVVRSIAAMTVGGLLMGIGDVDFNISGYICALASCLLQSLHLILVNKLLLTEEKLEAIETTFFHCLCAIPMSSVFVLGSREFSVLQEKLPQLLQDVDFVLVNIASTVLSVLLIFTTHFCNQVNSPITVSATGQVKALLQAVVAIVLFHTEHPPLNVLGIIVASVGSMGYVRAKYFETRDRERQKEVEMVRGLDDKHDELQKIAGKLQDFSVSVSQMSPLSPSSPSSTSSSSSSSS